MEDMHYRVKNKLSQTLDCSLLVVTTNNLILYLDKRIQSLSFNGVIEREWILDGPVCYIKVIGGPPSRERLLAGLENGQVMEIYLDNPFPSLLAKIDGPVKCLDVSSMKEKLAVVSGHGALSVFDLYNDKKLQEFQDVTSVAFNSIFEDMICFSGQDYLAIKVADFPEYKQKFSGVVVGLNGSKLYCLHKSIIITMEVYMHYTYTEENSFLLYL